MDPAVGTTTYTSSRRTTLVLAAALLFTLAVPLLPFIDEDGARRISEDFARHPLAFVLGTGFWLAFAAIMIAAFRANYLMLITCGPQSCRYRLPHVKAWDFFRRPFALRTGEIPYSMISGVEKRREKLRKWGQTCLRFACLLVTSRFERSSAVGLAIISG
jgi:hypothetical protein